MSRTVGLVCALGLAVLCAVPEAEAQLRRINEAARRMPQRPVVGETLQQRLGALDGYIVAAEHQVDGELIASSASLGSTYTVLVELLHHASGLETGIYNGHDGSATLMPVFPGNAAPGWFTVISFRNNPTRAIMNRFNELAVLLGTTTWLGADRAAIGVYAKGPSGTSYSQDSRNPGAAAHLLYFAGTGLNFGAAWLAVEADSVTDAGGAYDDSLWYLESTPFGLTPIRRTSWGRLKSRFR